MSKSFSSLKECLCVDDRVTFGKYTGLTWLDVLATDPNYIVWCVGNTDHKFDPTLVVRAIQQDYAHRKARTIARSIIQENIDSFAGPYFGADDDVVSSGKKRRYNRSPRYLDTVEWGDGIFEAFDEFDPSF